MRAANTHAETWTVVVLVRGVRVWRVGRGVGQLAWTVSAALTRTCSVKRLLFCSGDVTYAAWV